MAASSGISHEVARPVFGALGGFAISALISACFFAKERSDLKKDLEAGTITPEFYRDSLIEKGCEMAGGSLGGGVGTVAFLGMSALGAGTLISVGTAIVVGIIGSLIAANVGSWLGKKIVSRIRLKKQKDR